MSDTWPSAAVAEPEPGRTAARAPAVGEPRDEDRLGLAIPVLVQAGRRRRAGAATWMALAGILLGAVALVVSVRVWISVTADLLELVRHLHAIGCGA